MNLKELKKDPEFKEAYSNFYKFVKQLDGGTVLSDIDKELIPYNKDVMYLFSTLIKEKTSITNKIMLQGIGSYIKSFNTVVATEAIKCLLTCGGNKSKDILLEIYTGNFLLKEKFSVKNLNDTHKQDTLYSKEIAC